MNSWEQLNMSLNSTQTTEVKIMFPNWSCFKRAFQLSHRLYSQTKTLEHTTSIFTFTKQAQVEFRGFFTCCFHLWNWQSNKYVLSMRLCHCMQEILNRKGNYICYYRSTSCSGYREIKFLRKSFSFSSLNSLLVWEEKLLTAIHLLLNIILKS